MRFGMRGGNVDLLQLLASARIQPVEGTEIGLYAEKVIPIPGQPMRAITRCRDLMNHCEAAIAHIYLVNGG